MASKVNTVALWPNVCKMPASENESIMLYDDEIVLQDSHLVQRETAKYWLAKHHVAKER